MSESSNTQLSISTARVSLAIAASALILCAPGSLASIGGRPSLRSNTDVIPRYPQDNRTLNNPDFLFQNEPSDRTKIEAERTLISSVQTKTFATPLTPQEIYNEAWSAIKHDFADQTFNGQNWDKWQHKYDDKLHTPEDAKKAVETLIASLGDRFTFLSGSRENKLAHYDAPTEICGVGLQLIPGRRVFEPLENSPAAKLGVKKFWRITSVDGQEPGRTLEQIAEKIRGPEGTSVTIGFLTDTDEEKLLTLTRTRIPVPTITKTAIMNDDVGYVRINSLRDSTCAELEQALRKLSKTNSLIVDLRDCDGYSFSAALKVADLFLKPNQCISIVRYNDNNRPSTKAYYSTGKAKFKKRVAVLINRGTAGTPEIIAAALSDNGATTYGAITEGNATVQKSVELSPGMTLHVTSGIAISPMRQRRFNWIGLAPDSGGSFNYYNPDISIGRPWSDNGPWYMFGSLNLTASQPMNTVERYAIDPPDSRPEFKLADDEFLRDGQLMKAYDALKSPAKFLPKPPTTSSSVKLEVPKTPEEKSESAPLLTMEEKLELLAKQLEKQKEEEAQVRRLENERRVKSALETLNETDKDANLLSYFERIGQLSDTYMAADNPEKAHELRVRLLDEYLSSDSAKADGQVFKVAAQYYGAASTRFTEIELFSYFDKLLESKKSSSQNFASDGETIARSVHDSVIQTRLLEHLLTEAEKRVGSRSPSLDPILDHLCYKYHNLNDRAKVEKLLRMRKNLLASGLCEQLQRDFRIYKTQIDTNFADDAIHAIDTLLKTKLKVLTLPQTSAIFELTRHLRDRGRGDAAERIENSICENPNKSNSSLVDYWYTERYFKFLREKQFDDAEKVVRERVESFKEFGPADKLLSWWRLQLGEIDAARKKQKQR